MKKLILMMLLTTQFIYAQGNKGLTGAVDKLQKIHPDCPEGFINIHNGKNGEIGKSIGCIQLNQESSKLDWFDATYFCFNKFAGRLPSLSEWYVVNKKFTLNNLNDGWEWSSTVDYSPPLKPLLIGRGDGTSLDKHAYHYKINFRCFIPK